MSRREGTLSRRLRAFAASALLGLTLAAAAEPPPTVDTIVANYLTARGGSEKLRSIQTLRQKGRAIAGSDRQALVTRELKRPGRIRFEFTVQGVTSVFASDGKQGWKVSPAEGDLEPKPLSEEVVNEALEQAEIAGPLLDWKDKGHRLELAGREAVNGVETYKLKLTLKSGAVRHEYIDVKSFRAVRMDSTRLVRGRAVGIVTTFGDFRKTDGILFPHTIEVVASGRPQSLRIVLDRIDVNPVLADTRFANPVPAKP